MDGTLDVIGKLNEYKYVISGLIAVEQQTKQHMSEEKHRRDDRFSKASVHGFKCVSLTHGSIVNDLNLLLLQLET